MNTLEAPPRAIVTLNVSSIGCIDDCVYRFSSKALFPISGHHILYCPKHDVLGALNVHVDSTRNSFLLDLFTKYDTFQVSPINTSPGYDPENGFNRAIKCVQVTIPETTKIFEKKQYNIPATDLRIYMFPL